MVVNLGSRTAAVVRKGLSGFGIALLVSLVYRTSRRPSGPGCTLVCDWRAPLDFDAPHDGQVIAHIDVLGRIAPDISRIRITNTADNAVVWDVKPLSNRSECWNDCWNLTFQIAAEPGAVRGRPSGVGCPGASAHTRFPDKVESDAPSTLLRLRLDAQTVLAAPSEADAIARALELLAAAEDGESFVRTFTYTSGPAYGLLLDASSRRLDANSAWQRRIRPCC